jgi:hypothetical protein
MGILSEKISSMIILKVKLSLMIQYGILAGKISSMIRYEILDGRFIINDTV